LNTQHDTVKKEEIHAKLSKPPTVARECNKIMRSQRALTKKRKGVGVGGLLLPQGSGAVTQKFFFGGGAQNAALWCLSVRLCAPEQCRETSPTPFTVSSLLQSRIVIISLFASKYTYLNIIYVNGRSPEKHRVQLAGDL